MTPERPEWDWHVSGSTRSFFYGLFYGILVAALVAFFIWLLT